MSDPLAKPVKTAAAAHELRVNVSSDPACLAEVRRACEAFCVACGLSAAAVADVGLCVNEAMANVMRHAYGGATDRPIAVAARFDGRAVYITIRDWGSGEVPPGRARHDPLVPGGLGLVCLRRLMDDVVYTPQADGMLLTLTKCKA
jgi:anti-sigma regulatory factor (Ser/Thr protein kinase)